MLPPDILSKIKPENGVEAIKGMRDVSLNILFAGDRMVRLLETPSPFTDNYSVAELIIDLNKGIFSELKDKNQIKIYRRNIQKLYVDQLIELIKPYTS